MLLGLTGVFAYNVFFFMGLERIEASRASLIIANNPVFIAIFSALIYRDRLSPAAVLGILISVTGAAVVITRGDLPQTLQGGVGAGELFIFGWRPELGGLLPHRKDRAHRALAFGRGHLVLADRHGCAPAPRPAWKGSHRPPLGSPPRAGRESSTWGCSVLWPGLSGTIGGIREIGPARASQFINLVPVSAILLGALILHETLSPALLIGAALVLTGITLTNRASARS